MVHLGDGDARLIHLGVSDDVVAGDGSLQIVLEELFHLSSIRPGAAQEGGSLKGAPAGAHGKLLGIQHDAGQQGLGLGPEEVGRLHDVLEKLGDQLAGGGGVGLVEVEGGALNVGGGPAVVIDDRHPVARSQQLLGVDLLWAVGIHYYQQGGGVSQHKGLLGGDEDPLVLGQGLQLVRHDRGGVGPRLPDDVGLDPPLAGQGTHAGGSADAVKVGELVAGDEQSGGVGGQLAQGVGHDPALDLGALFGLLGPAAVELEVELVLDNRLIAAPGQSHVDGQRGILEQLLEAVGILADADGHGGRDARLVVDGVDGIQYGELLLLELGQVLLLKDEEVVVPVVPAEEASGGSGPLVQLLVDLAEQGGAGVVAQALEDLLIVVQQEDGHHGAGGPVGVPDAGELGYIYPIGGGQKALPLLLAGTHQVAEDQKAPLTHHHLLGALALALHQPAGAEVGHGGGELGVEEVVPLSGELEESLVGPDDLVSLGLEDDHGQGCVDHGVLGGHVDVRRDTVDVLENLPLSAAIGLAEVDIQGHDDHRLGQGQVPVPHNGGSEHEADHGDKIKPQAGLQQTAELVFPFHLFASSGCIIRDSIIPKGWGKYKCARQEIRRARLSFRDKCPWIRDVQNI